MVALAQMLVGEQPEKQEHVAESDTVVAEVRLCRSALSEQAFVTYEHRVFMTKVVTRNPTPSDALDNFA